MTGLASNTLMLSAAVTAVLLVAWITTKIAKREVAARYLAIAFWTASVLCLSYITIDKMINVSYAKGLYAVIGVTVVCGVAAGLALRRARG